MSRRKSSSSGSKFKLSQSKSPGKAARRGAGASNEMGRDFNSIASSSRDRQLTAFGERLVSALQAKGMNDSDLAKALGIAQPNIHTLKYKTDRPRSATVMRIAKILGLSPEDLMPKTVPYGDSAQSSGTKVYLVIESKSGRQTIRLA